LPGHALQALAVVLNRPGDIELKPVAINEPQGDELVVDVTYSGISTGTEKLLWSGEMPAFPGMGYPLVPGYESVGRVVHAPRGCGVSPGQTVFVPGARCYRDLRGLFGGAASRLVVPAARVCPVDEALGAQAVLLALAATAYHAVACGGLRDRIAPPELIVGHGVLGRLLARMTVAGGYAPPMVWETCAARRAGAEGYRVVDPQDDPRRDYRAIYDVSGDADLLDALIARMAPGGEIVLAGFYSRRLGFDFAPAFMREAQIRAAAEWKPADLQAVNALLRERRLSLDGLITHVQDARQAGDAYRTAFADSHCLKMILDWRAVA
jgi:3-hydroxyethyl bacteriochlorophyllide a dehydrogenase